MSKLQPVRGTHDLYGEIADRHAVVEAIAGEQFRRYNFDVISTPIFEFTDVFARNLGETSDIVSKEMYTFEDRGGDSITLRPEFTAGVVRAFISNGWAQNVPMKVCMAGPIFRYERPQKGRQRQFHQLGVEIFGVASAQADVEVITLGHDILKSLGLADKVVLNLNTLGDMESRQMYRDTLVSYLDGHKDKLSERSVERLTKNPLRILDSKEKEDQDIIKNAPSMADSMNQASKDFFQQVQDELSLLNIPFTLNPTLVRGMDYYCHTVFEFITDELGAQGTVLAGGRYDGLVKLMGGPDTPAVGWGAGIERLAMMLQMPKPAANKVALVPCDAESYQRCVGLAHQLRGKGFVTDLGYAGNMGKRMKRADKVGAAFAVIIGEDELKQNAATVRDLSTGQQKLVQLEQVASYLGSI